MSVRSLRTLGVTVVALLTVLLSVGPAGAGAWRFEVLDGDSGTGGRIPTSAGLDKVTLEYQGQIHLFYKGSATLRHAWFTGTWHYERLDPVGIPGPGDNIGDGVSATLWQNQIHLFTHERPSATALSDGTLGGNLVHHWFDGQWHREVLDGEGGAGGRTTNVVGEDTKTAVYGTSLQVFYNDETAGRLRHAWWNGAAWTFEDLDGGGTTTSPHGAGQIQSHTLKFGEDPSIVPQGSQFHVWYRGDDGVHAYTNLRHSWWDGARWNFEVIDASSTVASGLGVENAAILFAGQPHVWYYDAGRGALRHAWYDGAWHTEALDGGTTGGNAYGQPAVDAGETPAVTIFQGAPHVWYYAPGTGGTQRHAWWSGSTWLFEKLDGQANTYGQPQVDSGLNNASIISGGQLHVFSYDIADATLRHAWFG